MSGLVLTYRDDLLRPSEGFVTDSVRHWTRYRPLLLGTRILPGYRPDLPTELVCRRGWGAPRARVAAYRMLGPDRRTVDHLRRLRPRLVHAHFGVDAVQALPLAERLGVPLVTTFHGWEVEGGPDLLRASHRGRHYLARRAELARRGALFLPVSEHLRTALLAQGFPADRTLTHYLGTDLTTFSPHPGPREGILLVGRLVPAKGVDLLLRAVSRLPGRPSVTIVGDGPQRSALEELAATLDVRARFLGAQPRPVVVQQMQRAAVLCCPSVKETFGLVSIEAQAMRLPVVAHRVGGLPEAVRHEQTGLLVEPGDPAALAAALARLLDSAELRDRWGANGRRHVLASFDVRRRAEVLEGLYDGLPA